MFFCASWKRAMAKGQTSVVEHFPEGSGCQKRFMNVSLQKFVGENSLVDNQVYDELGCLGWWLNQYLFRTPLVQ